MFKRLAMGGMLLAALVVLTAAGQPASAALLTVNSDDLDQTDDPDIGVPAPFPDNGYDGTLSSMEQFLLDVSTEDDEIVSVEMSLWLAHGAVGEVFAKLESPQGTRIAVINRPGGGEESGDSTGATGNNSNFGPADDPVELLFYDSASVSAEQIGVGLGGDEVVGVDGSAVTDYAPAPDGSADTGGFAAYVGEDPNGSWTLYLADTAITLMGGGQGGMLHRWELRIETIPEPATLALLGMGGALLAARRRSR
jgi:subtilisin-like proprotein convertase family protein